MVISAPFNGPVPDEIINQHASDTKTNLTPKLIKSVKKIFTNEKKEEPFMVIGSLVAIYTASLPENMGRIERPVFTKEGAHGLPKKQGLTKSINGKRDGKYYRLTNIIEI